MCLAHGRCAQTTLWLSICNLNIDANEVNHLTCCFEPHRTTPLFALSPLRPFRAFRAVRPFRAFRATAHGRSIPERTTLKKDMTDPVF
jgi:hypothetical protein